MYICVCICAQWVRIWNRDRQKGECLPVLCVSLHYAFFIVFAAPVMALSCFFDVSPTHLRSEAMRAQTLHLWHRRGLLEVHSDSRVVLLLFVFATEKPAEVTFLSSLHPLPPSFCSSPLPLSSGVSWVKAGKWRVHCFYGTKIYSEILLIFSSSGN